MKRVVWLDVVRITGAVLVIFSHYVVQASILFPKGPFQEQMRLLRSIHINEGIIGISLLFFISGYLFALAMQTKKYNYLLSRFIRLYPPYIMSIIVLICIKLIGGAHIPNSPYNIFLHIFLIPDIMKVDSMNAVLWTFWIQIHFYIVYSVVFEKKLLSPARLIIFSLVVCFVTIFSYKAQLEKLPGVFGGIGEALSYNGIYFLFTSMGIVSYMFISHRWSRKTSMLTLLSISILFLITLFNAQTYGFRDEVLVSFSVGVILIYAIYSLRTHMQLNIMVTYLSAITFPLYLLHREFGIVMYPLLRKYGHSYGTSLLIICVALIAQVVCIGLLQQVILRRFAKV